MNKKSDSGKWRLFIAVEISPEARDRFVTLQENMRKAVQFTPARVSWSRPEGAHLTLQFLGDVEKGRIEEISKAIDQAVKTSRVSPFVLGVRNVGGFPNLKRPRVIWIGVEEGRTELTEIHKALTRETQRIGFKPEGRAFNPHLTLARVKSAKGIEILSKVLRRFQSKSCGKFIADKIILFRSELKPSGAIYTRVHEAPLHGKPPIKDEEDTLPE